MQDAVTIVMSGAPEAPDAGRERWRAVWRNAFPFMVVGALCMTMVAASCMGPSSILPLDLMPRLSRGLSLVPGPGTG